MTEINETGMILKRYFSIICSQYGHFGGGGEYCLVSIIVNRDLYELKANLIGQREREKGWGVRFGKMSSPD